MKLIREHINEKFIPNSDPIQDLGIGLLPRFPITVKQFHRAEDISLVSLLNKQFYRDFYWHTHGSIQDTNIIDILKLSKNNKQFFVEKYGKPDFSLRGEDYIEYVWAFKLPSGGLFVVLTGKRGTSYMCSSNLTENDEKRILHFLDYLVKTIILKDI